MARTNTGSSSNYLSASTPVLTALPVTMACWFKAGSTSVGSNLMGLYSATNYLYLVFDGANGYSLGAGRIIGDPGESSATPCGSSVAISNLNWHHCACVFASATSRNAYLDGLGGTTNVSNTTPNGIVSTYLGIYPPTFSPLNGQLAHAAIWSAALTGPDIALLASGACPMTVRPDALRAYWPLTGNNSRSPEPDLVGRWPMTVTGTYGVADDPAQVISPFEYWQNRASYFLPLISITAPVTVSVGAVSGSGVVGGESLLVSVGETSVSGLGTLGGAAESSVVSASAGTATSTSGSTAPSQPIILGASGVVGTGALGSTLASQSTTLSVSGVVGTGSLGSAAELTSFSAPALTGSGVLGGAARILSSGASAVTGSGVFGGTSELTSFGTPAVTGADVIAGETQSIISGLAALATSASTGVATSAAASSGSTPAVASSGSVAGFSIYIYPTIVNVAAVSAAGISGPIGPTVQPLIFKENLEYLGAFRVTADTLGVSSFNYGGTAITYNPANNSIFAAGHPYNKAVAEIGIPSSIVNSTSYSDLALAPIIQNFSEVLSRIPNDPLANPAGGSEQIGGLKVANGKLIGTAFDTYDVAGIPVYPSHFLLDSLNVATAGVTGLYTLGTQISGQVAGYMTDIPPEWHTLLGAPVLTGQGALSGPYRTSYGPGAFGFDPAALNLSGTPDVPYFYYPDAHQTIGGYDTNPPTYYNQNCSQEGNTGYGCAFPVGTRSVLFFGARGRTNTAYGEAIDALDPYRFQKGNHAVNGDYEFCVLAYDANDFLAVVLGQRNPWDITPVTRWDFDLPVFNGAKLHGGVAYDPSTQRIYFSEVQVDLSLSAYAFNPIFHVFQVSLPPALTPVTITAQSLSGPISVNVSAVSGDGTLGETQASYRVFASISAVSVIGTSGGTQTTYPVSMAISAVFGVAIPDAFTITVGPSVAISVGSVAAYTFAGGYSSWQTIVASPATVSWNPIQGTYSTWSTLATGTMIVVAKFDGTNYTNIDAFTVQDNTLVDLSGASVGVDSLWYWDVWTPSGVTSVSTSVAIQRTGLAASAFPGSGSVQPLWQMILANPGTATWYPIPGTYATWSTLATGTIILASKFDGTNYTNLDVFTVQDNTLVDSSGASIGVDSLWYWDIWTYGGAAPQIITVNAGGVSGSGLAGGTTEVLTASMPAVTGIDILGGLSQALVFGTQSAAGLGTIGGISFIVGVRTVVTASGVFSSAFPGGDSVTAISGIASILGSTNLGVASGAIASGASATFGSSATGSIFFIAGSATIVGASGVFSSAFPGGNFVLGTSTASAVAGTSSLGGTSRLLSTSAAGVFDVAAPGGTSEIVTFGAPATLGVGTFGSITFVAGVAAIVTASGVFSSASLGGDSASVIFSASSIAGSSSPGSLAVNAFTTATAVAATSFPGAFSFVAGSTTVVNALGVFTSGDVGSVTELMIAGSSSVVGTGAISGQSAGPGPSASGLLATAIVGGVAEPQALGFSAVTGVGTLGGRSAGPWPSATGRPATGAVGGTSELLSFGLSASLATGIPGVSAVGASLSAVGLSASGIAGGFVPATIAIAAAQLATGVDGGFTVFNGGVVVLSMAGVFASMLPGVVSEAIAIPTMAPEVDGIPGVGASSITVYVAVFPDPFGAVEMVRIDVFRAVSSEGLDPFRAQGKYGGN